MHPVRGENRRISSTNGGGRRGLWRHLWKWKNHVDAADLHEVRGPGPGTRIGHGGVVEDGRDGLQAKCRSERLLG